MLNSKPFIRMKNFRFILSAIAVVSVAVNGYAIDHRGITSTQLSADRFTLVDNGSPTSILIDSLDEKGVAIAAANLQTDFQRVSGNRAKLSFSPDSRRMIIVGSLKSKYIASLVKARLIDGKELQGKTEKYVMTVVNAPFNGVDEALVIAGSDKRGAIYGIYELSEQIGVSPWYDWADVPVRHEDNLAIAKGTYTAGEPAVRYRGIFLNDEAPCLTGWVKHTYGTNYGDHNFYARVFELILRLRGNFMWPAMWGWSFYADDPLNSATANEMGVIMGTSHHEPMARNHQEWARHRSEYGEWNYSTNQAVIDKFFREGMERAAGTEDLITIGMRGDGDAPMGGKEGKDHEYKSEDERNMALLTKIFKNQRSIIKDVTGKSAEKRPQVWAVYKEVQHLYDLGLRAPDDVIMLVCDDNWGNVRKLPDAEERKRSGGWGMYYHVDYVGAPRNSKWINVTPIQNLWEQMSLTYDYGVDKLWIVNVGDLKPMEYPITLFLNMAWNPKEYSAATLHDHTLRFCEQQFGEQQGDEAARILNLYCKYAGRVTPEMLDATTYNLQTGEWKQVTDEWIRLEAEALRQYMTLDASQRDAYQELILFPVQVMANLYDMYYSQAMNRKLFAEANPAANYWADRVEAAFKRDSALCSNYNNVVAGGKWKNMMTQKHIGYTSWNDDFPADRMPDVSRIENHEAAVGGYTFTAQGGVVAMEAEHYFSTASPAGTEWTVIPDMGRTLSGVALMPYTANADGASITYRMTLPDTVSEVKLHVIVKSTLAFKNREGHRYTVALDNGAATTVNYNANLNEEGDNTYTVFYPTVARRVVDSQVSLPVDGSIGNVHTLTLRPLDPAIVFEKIVVDCGGYEPSYLFWPESPCSRSK
jgi:hypothetical protein